VPAARDWAHVRVRHPTQTGRLRVRLRIQTDRLRGERHETAHREEMQAKRDLSGCPARGHPGVEPARLAAVAAVRSPQALQNRSKANELAAKAWGPVAQVVHPRVNAGVALRGSKGGKPALMDLVGGGQPLLAAVDAGRHDQAGVPRRATVVNQAVAVAPAQDLQRGEDVRTSAGDKAEAGPGLEHVGDLSSCRRVFRQLVHEAVFDVVFHKEQANLVQAATDGHNLSQHLFAVAAGVEHALNTLDLALDAAQARRQALVDEGN
jgi:hypothetical protein